MRNIILASLLLMLPLLFGCNSATSSQQDKPTAVEVRKSPEELRAELRAQESSNPREYIHAGQTSLMENNVLVREAGLFRKAQYKMDGYFLKGAINNNATIAKFKDAVLTVQFKSQTQTVIEQKDFTVYDFFEAGSTKPFSLHVYPPHATASYTVGIKTATAID